MLSLGLKRRYRLFLLISRLFSKAVVKVVGVVAVVVIDAAQMVLLIGFAGQIGVEQPPPC